MTDDVKFGELLGNYRARCGWSQGELAKKVGVSRNAIVLWERHERGRQTNTHPQARGVVLRLADELLLSKEERKGFLDAAGFSIEHWPAEYWNVPYPHNPYFVGRETILQTLQQRLVPGEKATALTQSISGFGGIGKTQIAIEYAHLYGEQYEAVLWIQADSQEMATAGLLRLATKTLGLPEQQEAEQQIAEVKRWLQKRHNWLLIFDNAENPQAILSAFVPSKHQGSILVTTRRRDAGVLAHNEVLPLLSENEAILFLLRRAGRIAKNASVTEATSSDFFPARDLCQLLDRLPLALDQAGAYIAENGGPLQKYIDLYHQFRRELLNRRSANEQRGSRNKHDHPASVFVTFSLSWQQIQERNALAGKMLQFCAFLAPNQIPEQLVLDGIAPLEAESTREALEKDEALGLLHRYSLIERAEQTLTLHRLVQEVMQEVLSEEERDFWMEQAVCLVNAIFPSGGGHKTWPQCEFLLPHALTCTKWIPVLKQKKLEGGQLLNATGSYLCERGRYVASKPLLELALSICEEQLGSDHPDTATSLSNLAMLYHNEGRHAEAELLYLQALSIHEEQSGSDHPDTATGLNNLALFYQSQGRYAEAEPLYLRALSICEKQLEADHFSTIASLNNLALFYQSQGRYAEAELLYLQALSIREEQLGDDHLLMIAGLNNLAHLYQSQGRYAEAEPLYLRVSTIFQEQLGADYPLTPGSLNDLAGLYCEQGRYAEAEPLYLRALSIREKQLGDDHPDTATSLNNLALLYQNQGRYAEAKPLYLRVLSICEEQSGDDHPDTATSLNNLALLYQNQGRYAEAEPLYLRALSIREKQLIDDHPLTANSLNDLSRLYHEQGRYAEAEPLYLRALSIREKQLGSEHPDTATNLNNLAGLYYKQGRYAEAEPLYIRVLSIREKQLGAEHPLTANSLNNLAALFESQRRYAEAEPLYLRALSIREKQLGSEHPDTAASLDNLAGFYHEQGRYAEAEPLYHQAAQVSLACLGLEHPQTQQILRNHLMLLAEMHTNGDMEMLLQLLASEQEDPPMKETMQE